MNICKKTKFHFQCLHTCIYRLCNTFLWKSLSLLNEMYIFYILLKPSLIFICVHEYVFFKKYCLIFLFFWIDIKEAQDYSMLHVKTVYNITPCQASQHAPLPLLPSQKTRSYNNVLPYPLPLPEISHAGINKLWTG